MRRAIAPGHSRSARHSIVGCGLGCSDDRLIVASFAAAPSFEAPAIVEGRVTQHQFGFYWVLTLSQALLTMGSPDQPRLTMNYLDISLVGACSWKLRKGDERRAITRPCLVPWPSFSWQCRLHMNIGPYQAILRIIGVIGIVCGITSVNAQSIAAGERKHGFCASCHGINGQSRKIHYPILAGQAAPYILSQLRDFKQGRRSDPTMTAIVPQLSDEDMRDLAAFFASLKPYSSPSKSDTAKAILGKKQAEIRHCATCHVGRVDQGSSKVPRIQGQHRNYVEKQLKDFRAGRRTNDVGVMDHVAPSLSDTDIENLGNYFASISFDKRNRSLR